MSSPHVPDRVAGWLTWGAWGMIAVSCVLTALVAAGMRNDHADSYEYLRMSQRIWSSEGAVARGRPPLLSLLQAPLWSLREKGAVWLGAHLLQTIIFAGAAVLVLVTGRRWIGGVAGGVVMMLCLDRVFIHFAPSAMTDHLALASLALSNILWRAGVEERGPCAAAATGAVTAVLTHSKYILAVVPLSLFVAGRATRGWRARVAYGLGVIAGLLATRGVVEHMTGQPITGTVSALVNAYVQGATGAYVGQFSWLGVLSPLRFLVLTMSPGLVVAGVVGWLRTGREFRALKLQFVLWLAILCFVLGEKEARYLLPVLPVAYMFSAAGLLSVWRRVGGAVGGRLCLVGLLVLLAPPMGGARREWTDHLFGGINSHPAEALADEVAVRLGPDGRVFWRGGAFPLYRSRRVRIPGDDYYDAVRLGPAGLAFWLGEPCLRESRAVPVVEGPVEGQRALSFVRGHHDGDVIVMAPPRGAHTGTLDLVSVAMARVRQEGPVVPDDLLRRAGAGVAAAGPQEGDLTDGFVLVFCRGHVRTAPLKTSWEDLCDDPEMLGLVWLVRLSRTTVATTEEMG